MLSWATVTSHYVFFLTTIGFNHVMADLPPWLASNGVYKSLWNFTDTNCSTNATACPFAWNNQMLTIDIQLEKPSDRVQGILITCDHCCGPLDAILKINNAATYTLTLWPSLDLLDPNQPSNASKYNSLRCHSNDTGNITSPPSSCLSSENATVPKTSYYEFHASLMGRNITAISVSLSNDTTLCIADEAPCCPDAVCQNVPVIRRVDVFGLAENITKRTMDLTNESNGVVCSPCNPRSYQVNSTISTNSTLGLIIDLFGDSGETPQSEFIYPPIISVDLVQTTFSNESIVNIASQQKFMFTTHYSHRCRRYLSAVPLYFASDDVISGMTPSSQTTLRSSVMPSSTKKLTSAASAIGPQNVQQRTGSPGDTATLSPSSTSTSTQGAYVTSLPVLRQEIRIESVTITFPACIATSYVIRLKLYENSGDKLTGNKTSVPEVEDLSCDNDGGINAITRSVSRRPSPSPNSVGSTGSGAGPASGTTWSMTEPPLTTQTAAETTTSGTSFPSTIETTSMTTRDTSSSPVTTLSTGASNTVNWQPSTQTTQTTDTTSSSTSTTGLTSSTPFLSATATSVYGPIPNITSTIATTQATTVNNSSPKLISFTSSKLSTTPAPIIATSPACNSEDNGNAGTNYTMTFKIKNELYQLDLKNSSSALYVNYSSFIIHEIDNAVNASMCLTLRWRQPMVFRNGSIITECWLTSFGSVLLDNSTQFSESITRALWPRFVIDSINVSRDSTISKTNASNLPDAENADLLNRGAIIGIGVACGVLFVILVLLIVLVVIAVRRHHLKRVPQPESTNIPNSHDGIMDSWSIPRPHPSVWQSNNTMTSSMLNSARYQGDNPVSIRPTPQVRSGLVRGSQAHNDDVTAELDRAIAEHDTASNSSSRDRWTPRRHDDEVFPVPKLHRVDTDMLYLPARDEIAARSAQSDVTESRRFVAMETSFTSSRNNVGMTNYNISSREPTVGASRDTTVRVAPETNNFNGYRRRSEEIGDDARRGPETLHHVTSVTLVTNQREFDEESFSDVLTYYGSTGNLQKGGVLTLLQRSISQATGYLKTPKVDNIHRTPPGYMKTSSPRDKPTRQRVELVF